MEPHIVSVKVIPGHCLQIQFDDGTTVTKDLTPLIAKGNLYADLEDEKFLKQVQIIDRGYALGWPNGLEFCIDSLNTQETKPSISRRRRVTTLTH